MKPILSLFFTILIVAQASAQQPLTLEEAVLGQFRQFAPERMSQLAWLPQSDTYVWVRNDSLMSGTVKGKTSAVLTLAQLKEIYSPSLSAFPGIEWIDATRFYFQDGDAFVHVDLKARKADKALVLPEGAANTDYHPASRSAAYTVDNNLHIHTPSKNAAITQLDEGIVAGQSISRNEYGISKGTFWSPDGTFLAFYQKDERGVTDYPLINYTTTPAQLNAIKYPMAGASSEIVSVGVYSVAAGKTVYLDLTRGAAGSDQYYATNLTWSPDNKSLYIALLNRSTTEVQLRRYDALTGKELSVVFTESDNAWVEPSQPLVFLPNDPSKFLWYSWQDGFHNYYLYSADGRLLGQTKATFELTGILGFDPTVTTLFVEGTGENPTEMHAYSVNLTDWSMRRITPASGTHQVKVSGSGRYILDSWSSLTVVQRTELSGADGRSIRTLLDSKDALRDKAIGRTEIITIPGADGTDLYARVIKPSNFDSRRQYPVIVYVYNGPHVQLVTNSWLGGASLWMNYLAEQGYIVFTLDGRGSAHRGKKFEQAIHRQLGTREIEDQAAGVKWLKQQPWVDASRMGVHGWSYGGFMTTSLMLRLPGTFKVGVAGGPVIDWRLYEVMYTERYMDTPAENADGYAKADLTQYVKNLQGDLLMIHGTDDDVVVMQHNMRFLKACIDAKEQVDFFAYPGHAHNVRGKDRVHLMQKVIDYLTTSLAE